MISFWRMMSKLLPGKDESWIDVGIDTAVAVVVAVVLTEVLRTLIG